MSLIERKLSNASFLQHIFFKFLTFYVYALNVQSTRKRKCRLITFRAVIPNFFRSWKEDVNRLTISKTVVNKPNKLQIFSWSKFVIVIDTRCGRLGHQSTSDYGVFLKYFRFFCASPLSHSRGLSHEKCLTAIPPGNFSYSSRHEDFCSRIGDARARLHECVERFGHGLYIMFLFFRFDSSVWFRVLLLPVYAKFAHFGRSNGWLIIRCFGLIDCRSVKYF